MEHLIKKLVHKVNKNHSTQNEITKLDSKINQVGEYLHDEFIQELDDIRDEISSQSDQKTNYNFQNDVFK